MGVVISDVIAQPTEQAVGMAKNYMFAQLVNGGGASRGGETDELIMVLDTDQASYLSQQGLGTVNYKLNGQFDQPWVKIENIPYCEPAGVRWGDFNNDGLDDYICLAPVSFPCKLCATLPVDTDILRCNRTAT